MSTPIKRLRAVGMIEGISYLALLGIAMPLKYLAGIPLAVRVVGTAHGVLFVLFVLALAQVSLRHRWAASRALVAFIASLVPFGTFWLDARLRQEEASAPA
jgi:integral membrane protein